MSPDARAVLGRAIADYRRLVAAESEHPAPADLAEVLYRMSLAARSLAAGALGLTPLLGTPELWLLDAQIAAYGRHPSQGHAAEMLERRIETAGGAVATLAKHLGILGTYPPRCHAVLPVGVLTPAMLAYPATRPLRRTRRSATGGRWRRLTSRPICPTNANTCTLMRSVPPTASGARVSATPAHWLPIPPNWRACPHAHT